MDFEEWWATLETREQHRADKALTEEAFAAGTASRDAEIETLRELKQAWHDKFWELDKQKNAEIAELVAALKPFGAIDLVESRLPAEFAMLVLRARATIAKVRKP